MKPSIKRPVKAPKGWRKHLPAVLFAVMALILAGSAWYYRAPLTNNVEEFIAKTIDARVAFIIVEGTKNSLPDELKTAIGLNKGDSLVGYNVTAARARLEALPWVRLATVSRKLPDTLKVEIYEHKPLATLKTEAGDFIVNKNGEQIVPAGADFAHLPIINGTGAEAVAAELFAMLGEHPNLASALKLAEFIGERRWDLTFASGFSVKLPEQNATQALKILQTMEDTRHVLVITSGMLDLRIEGRMILRIPDDAEYNKLVL